MNEKIDEEYIKCLLESKDILDSVLPDERAEKLAEIAKLLSSPTRLQILNMLRKSEVCVCVLSELLGKEQSSVSHHLAKLKSTGFIKADQRGKWIFYELADPKISEILDALEKLD